MPKPRIAFFGSPAFALPVLEALHSTFGVVVVVAQPNKPAGRGQKITPPAVAVRATELNLPLLQPEKLRRNEEFAIALRAANIDVAVTCAYGKILPASLLAIPERGFLNVHTSLLPAYRGAAPIQWAIANGETKTGVTIMQTDAGMDTGPILLQEAVFIGPDETVLELSSRLSAVGANLIVEALQKLDDILPQPQNETQASHARMIEKEDGEIHWAESTAHIYNRYRAFKAWPQSYFVFAGKRIKVLELKPVAGHGEPGEILAHKNNVVVATKDGAIELQLVQPETKSAMRACDWVRGLVGVSKL